MSLKKIEGFWYIDTYDDGGKRIRKKVSRRKREAEKVLKALKNQKTERKEPLAEKSSVLFDNFAQTYLEYSKSNKNPSSHRRDKSLVDNLLSFFSGNRMNSIDSFMIEQYKLMRIKKVSKSSVNRELSCLRHMYNLGIKWGMFEKNPVQKVRFFKEDPYNFKYLNLGEASKLIAHCNDHIRPIVVMALNTGMRKAEILKLKWKNVDLNNRIITVERTKAHDIRRIPINEMLYSELRKLPHHSEYVFADKNGKPYDNVRRAFHTARKRAGLEYFRFHDLRHTFASQLVMAGEDIVTVQQLMGHKTIEMTMRYSHLSDQHRINAVKRLGDLYENGRSKEKE